MKDIKLIKLKNLKPHEKIQLLRFLFLLIKIIKEGSFKEPILVDNKTKIILDGHHRWRLAKFIKLKYIPCCMVDYMNDKNIKVSSRRKSIKISKRNIIKNATLGKKYKSKTSKHEYKKLKKYINIPLKRLK
jgi:L-serine kinase (ADP)